MTAVTTAAEIANLLSLDDATEVRFLEAAQQYRHDSTKAYDENNKFQGRTLNQLAELARMGARAARREAAYRLLRYLRLAAEEIVPVGASVVLDLDYALGFNKCSVFAYGTLLLASANHPDALTAVRNAARSLLAREGADGLQCDALRAEVDR